ncbi:putative inner membrane transporter yiJE [Actinomadura rubteroloni]|uniref:Putative inner membrane transporter yiJE n=2 Tax=Actinomadura rubteroloni TaxID=1926885 RepID=A0A2P4UIN7_9ACTN|nr:putative inner membrane transporter yiJE [Actinomadura rubteroloni]
MIFVAAVWGASFLFMRQAVPVLGPVGMIEARVVLAGLALALACAVLRRPPRPSRKFLLLGALTAAVPFTLIGAAELRLTASLAALLNATTPLFSVLVTAARERRAPSVREGAGIVLGIAGVAVLVGLGPQRVDAGFLLAVAASLLASLAYALGGVYAEAQFRNTDPLGTAAGQQLGAALCLAPPAVCFPPRHAPGLGVAASVVALGLVCTALGFAAFFRLVERIGATGALSVTFLVPFFGLLWGTVFRGEPIGRGTPAGLALVLAAVVAVSRRPAARAAISDGRRTARTRH